MIILLEYSQSRLRTRRLVDTLLHTALFLLFMLCISSCANNQIQKDYERARTADTVSVYEEFNQKYQVSEYAGKVSERLLELQNLHKLEELQREKAQAEHESKIFRKKEELTAENSALLSKVTKYSIGKTSLSEFINDGWNADDPYLGKLGIVGVIHDTAVRTQKTVDIIMGFTYRSLDNDKESVLEPILKSGRAALGSELERLKRQNVHIQTNILPLMTPKNGKRWTKKEWDLHGGPQSLEPFFESTAVLKFEADILKNIDLSGIKYVDLQKTAGIETTVCNCTITDDWLEKTAIKSTKVPPPTAHDILNEFSGQELDKIQISYNPKDEVNLQGIGTVWKEQIPYLITKEKVTYLRAQNNKSSLIELAVLDRSSGKLRLNIELAKGKELIIDYQCKQVNP